MVWFARVAPLTLVLPLACASDRDPSVYDEAGDDLATLEGDDGLSTDEGESGPKLDQGADDGMNDGMAEGGDDCPMLGSSDASISGTVYAPNLEIPVSGALVWASKTKPDGIPQTVYCAECVELECGTNPWTTSEPDGSFELALDSGDWWIAVQKGQFLRLTQVSVAAGPNPLADAITSLPDRNDPSAGEYIPKIALAWGSYDRLEDGLAKLGLGDTLVDMNLHRETLIPGTQQFAVWDNAGGGIDLDVEGDFGQLLQNYPLLEQYHIIFVPCSNDFALFDLDQQAKVNLRKWVELGGKFYVSDWSNEFIGDTFSQYQTFWDDAGDTDLFSEYDSTGTVLDPELLAWLQALPQGLKDINPQNGGGGFPTINNLPAIETVNNWSGVKATPPVLVDDGMGGMVDVGHKTWVEGPGDGSIISGGNWPLTISAEYGCGKLMFTTYHTAEGSDAYIGLTPQELVLLYMILEIGVCQTPYQPPPPVG
ncbi:hypothetical protein ACNOYE_18510 [Nannocystaceae bacterium ST9]